MKLKLIRKQGADETLDQMPEMPKMPVIPAKHEMRFSLLLIATKTWNILEFCPSRGWSQCHKTFYLTADASNTWTNKLECLFC
jgi:hypothetical protein